MLNGRLYRAAFVPCLLALAIAAFSLQPLPAPRSSTLAPEAFEGAPAMSELGHLAGEFPDRRPGSEGDAALARYVAGALAGSGGSAGAGFSVRKYSFSAQTVAGEQTLTNVLATRPGSTSAIPLVIVAHRDAAGTGTGGGTGAGAAARAELSATAALIELARVFATQRTRRTIVLASTDGGSGGDEGAARLPGELHEPLDAAIVLGDLTGGRSRGPLIAPWSDTAGSAPLALQRTLDAAIGQQTSLTAADPSTLAQLVHLTFPLAAGEQGVLLAHGIPAVQVGTSNELTPRGGDGLSSEHLEGLGRSVLSAVDALDSAPNIATAAQSGLIMRHQELPGWALRLLVLTLILPVFVTAGDGIARLRRRGIAVAHWAGWTVSCAAPFFACALFAYLLGFLGVLGGAPGAPVLPRAMPFTATAAIALVTTLLVFVLAWMGWSALVQRLGWGTRPDADAAGLATVMVALALALLVWLANPLTALLMVPALHIFMALSTPQLRPRRVLGSIGLLALAALPLALVGLYYAEQLGGGPLAAAWGTLLLVAGGYVAPVSALLWSIAFGCGAASLLGSVAAELAPSVVAEGVPGDMHFTSRGPLTYAGPGSLGGTESALYR